MKQILFAPGYPLLLSLQRVIGEMARVRGRNWLRCALDQMAATLVEKIRAIFGLVLALISRATVLGIWVTCEGVPIALVFNLLGRWTGGVVIEAD